jgi:hypothetical protein
MGAYFYEDGKPWLKQYSLLEIFLRWHCCKCVIVNIIWKIIHSKWTMVLQLERSALQWTLYGRYFKADGHWYYSLNYVRYNEYYMEGTSQHEDIRIAAWMRCVAVKIIWKIIHSKWKLVLQHERSALEWTLHGRYFTASGHWLTAWINCVKVNITWKIFHSRWTML